jgi:uncharacterized FAD-dependent dehydrogenase
MLLPNARTKLQVPKYRIPQLKLPLDHQQSAIPRKICSILGTRPDNLSSWKVVKISYDARKRSELWVIYAVVVELARAIRGIGEGRDWIPATDEEDYSFPAPLVRQPGAASSRPVIVGAGPAGLFCALILAENGYAPLVLERGEDAETRLETVRNFWDKGELKPDSNMQFGEGGAGTFSDGKLNTSIGDKHHLNAKIIEEFIEAGAPSEIALSNKPHIGTDYLVSVVRGIREKIERLGGRVLFNAKATDFEIENGVLRSVMVNGVERIETRALALAIGHSARDTFETLSRTPLSMVQKPFAVGLRIEHPQELIQRNQFGSFWNHPALPAADYKLTCQASDGRGVYSFCMCPGGYVVNSSSEPGMVACNGMSDFARDSRNANSAIVAAVRTEDFGGSGVLDGIEFQRRWERAAFAAANPKGGFAMPVQRFGDFLAGRASTGLGSFRPCSRGAYALSDLNSCLPDYILVALKEGILNFDRKIKGFAHPDAILTGVETRTSSPIRILRDEGLRSSVAGLYPCGEGGGHSGGIMSSAMDGIRVAESIAKDWR